MARTLLVLLVGTSVACHTVQPRDEVRDYLGAKARYDSLARNHGLPGDKVPAALKDLETRMRRILGPDSIPGWRQSFNLTWLPCCDPGGWVLDGMLQYDSTSRTSVVVTAPGILDAWLEQVGEKAADPLVGLSHEDALTWVFDGDAHVYPLADLRSKSTPREVFLATLVERTNGDVIGLPDEVLVGVNTGRRIYVIIAPAAARIELVTQCGRALNEQAIPCVRRLVANHPDFPRLVDQAKALAALVTPRR